MSPSMPSEAGIPPIALVAAADDVASRDEQAVGDCLHDRVHPVVEELLDAAVGGGLRRGGRLLELVETRLQRRQARGERRVGAAGVVAARATSARSASTSAASWAMRGSPSPSCARISWRIPSSARVRSSWVTEAALVSRGTCSAARRASASSRCRSTRSASAVSASAWPVAVAGAFEMRETCSRSVARLSDSCSTRGSGPASDRPWTSCRARARSSAVTSSGSSRFSSAAARASASRRLCSSRSASSASASAAAGSVVVVLVRAISSFAVEGREVVGDTVAEGTERVGEVVDAGVGPSWASWCGRSPTHGGRRRACARAGRRRGRSRPRGGRWRRLRGAAPDGRPRSPRPGRRG